MRLKGKVAVITGASRGIGRAIAERFAQEGASLVLNSRSEEAMRDTTTACRQAGAPVALAPLDLTSPGACDALVSTAVSAMGRVDVLVNNAGVVAEQLLVLLSDDELDAMIATNAAAVAKLTRAAVRVMLRQRCGVIVNLSSIAASTPGRGSAVYAGTKGFVASFTRAVAAEVGRKGIRVNAVAPGVIATQMNEALRAASGDELRKRIAQQRFGSTDEVASVVAWLASDEASYVNGAVLDVDGGFGLGS